MAVMEYWKVTMPNFDQDVLKSDQRFWWISGAGVVWTLPRPSLP